MDFRMSITVIKYVGDKPYRKHLLDAGWDLRVSKRTVIPAGQFVDVPVNLRIAMPPGYMGRITGRSSTFRKRNLLVLEGIIDAGYRGDLFVGVHNMNAIELRVSPGDGPVVENAVPTVLDKGIRIAQLIIHKVPQVSWVPVEELKPSDDGRNNNGFGSTGL